MVQILFTKNSSSPETDNAGVCSTTSPEEMISVRTCYCKHEKNVTRKKDNIRIHNGNRYPATAVSKKSIVTNATCGSDRESCKRARRIINEETPNTNRSVEVQLSNPVLSPETSTALENAEKIINNAKLQLMEVCATSSFDSARRNKNTYSAEPPLDDEIEEQLYVRELVASKFHDACSSKLSEANGNASAHSEKRDFPRVTVRKVDLSAPKFRVSRRRRADWSSLGYGSDNRSRGRASPARVPSDSIEDVNKTTTRDDRARDRRRMLLARENACEIQTGPSVHIVDRELIRQDLEDVHISPEPSWAQSRANTATYTFCHDVVKNVDNVANDPEVSGTPRTRRVRMDTLQRGKSIGKPIIEVTTEAVPITSAGKLEKEFEDVKNSDSERNVGRIESPKVRDREERKDPDPQDAERIFERLKNTSQGTAKFVIENPRTDRNEKLHKVKNENHERILSLSAPASDTQIRHVEDDGGFCKKSDDRQRNDENTVDKIQTEENGDDRKSLLGDDTSRKAENIASHCRETARLYRLDRHFSHAFNSQGQDGLHNVAGEDVHRRSFASDCLSMDVLQETILAEVNFDEIDLYRPRLDDLDSILQSNDRKIERVARAARNLSELLSSSKFAIYKLDEDERVLQDTEKFYQTSLIDKNGEYLFALNERARSSILETELKNEDLTVSEVHRTNEDLQRANAAEMRSLAFTRENASGSNYSKNFVESNVFPTSDASDGLRTSCDSDRTQSVKAPLSELSMNRSDVTTFSNLVPALSSTHTETQMCRHQEKEITRHADTKSRVMSASQFSKRKIRRSEKDYIDDGIFERLFRKDTSLATDRFITYILQDEKRSIEGKIMNALKESTVTPAAVQKLLDHLREAESIRDARQTETLDILRNILINVKSQSDQGNANDKEISFRNIPESSIRTNTIDESREGNVQQAPAKIDTSEIEIAQNSYELKVPGESSECHETIENSTARCESTKHFENNSKRKSQVESIDITRIISIDVKNQTDKDVNENNLKKGETFSRNVTDSLIRTNATSDAIEETILRTQAENNTSDAGQIAGQSNDSKNPDKYFSPAETKESVYSATHFEAAKDFKNNSNNNSGKNSKENSCSETESLKQISDIHSDDENFEHLSTKIASARLMGGSEIEVVDLIVAVSENKDDINIKKLGDDISNETVQANKNQRANKIVTQADEVIEYSESNIPKDAVKEITPARKRVLFTFAEVSKKKNERVHSDMSSAKSEFIDEDLTKRDVGLVHSSVKEDTSSLRETKIDPQQAVSKKKIDPAGNCLTDPSSDCILSIAKSSESSLREVASTSNEQISSNIIGKDNSTRNIRTEEIRKSTTFATTRDHKENEILEPQKTARSDNERQPIDLTDTPRKCKIDVLSSSNSSVSSTLQDNRSINGTSSADARRIGTTPETSHSEGELYMPSSCSYSLGEVRILRRKRDLIEDNAMDRDSSVTVLVTRSMLTSFNDSTVSLLGSSEYI